MRQKSHLSLMALILSLFFMIFILLSNTETLHPGNGFGREIQLVLDKKDKTEAFDVYMGLLESEHMDVLIHDARNDKFIVSISGVADVPSFLTEFQTQLPGIRIAQAGSFGTLSTVTSLMKTFQVYMSVFFVVFISLWTYRFWLIGLLSSLVISLELTLTLFIADYLGYALSIQVWFTMLLVFSLLVFEKKRIINEFFDNTDLRFSLRSKHLLNDNRILIAILLLVLASIFYFSPFSLRSSGVFLLIMGLILFVERWIQNWIANMLIKDTTDLGDLSQLFERPYKPIGLSEYSKGISIRLIVLSVVLFALSGAIMGYMNRGVSRYDHEFAPQKLFVVSANDAQSFLEIQATFSKHGVLDSQNQYRVSEEKTTWFLFDDEASMHSLLESSLDIKDKINLESFVYAFSGIVDPFSNGFLYTVLFIVTIFCAFFFTLNYRNDVIVSFVLLVLGAFLIFNGFLYLFGVSLSRQVIIMNLFIPIFLVLYTKVNRLDSLLENWSGYIIRLTNRYLVLLSMSILPIITIIPRPSQDMLSMVVVLIIWAASMLMVALLFVFVQQFLRRRFVK